MRQIFEGDFYLPLPEKYQNYLLPPDLLEINCHHSFNFIKQGCHKFFPQMHILIEEDVLCYEYKCLYHQPLI